MPEITFICGGREVTAKQLSDSLPKQKPKSAHGPKRTSNRDEATHSHGFVVVGYPAGTEEEISSAYAQKLKACEANQKERHPGTLAEFASSWKRHTKPRRIGRPYSLADAANTCARLAEKAGWIDVQVNEILKA